MTGLMMAALLVQGAAGCNAVPPTAPPADCPSWRHLKRDSQGDIFIDPASIRRSGDALEVTLRVVNSRDQAGRARSATTLVWIDCVRRLGVARHITLFATDGTRIVDTDVTGAAAEPRPIGRDSPPAPVLAEYCPH